MDLAWSLRSVCALGTLQTSIVCGVQFSGVADLYIPWAKPLTLWPLSAYLILYTSPFEGHSFCCISNAH